MADLALLGNDIDTTGNELRLATGADYVAQKIGIRLRLVRGEWFLDTRVGLPYYETVFLKNPDVATIEGVFRRTIVTTPGVLELQSFSFEVDSNRVARLAFQARVTNDEILNFTDEFILNFAGGVTL